MRYSPPDGDGPARRRRCCGRGPARDLGGGGQDRRGGAQGSPGERQGHRRRRPRERCPPASRGGREGPAGFPRRALVAPPYGPAMIANRRLRLVDRGQVGESLHASRGRGCPGRGPVTRPSGNPYPQDGHAPCWPCDREGVRNGHRERNRAGSTGWPRGGAGRPPCPPTVRPAGRRGGTRFPAARHGRPRPETRAAGSVAISHAFAVTGPESGCKKLNLLPKLANRWVPIGADRDPPLRCFSAYY